MKLLFDENLSPTLVLLLADLFPNSLHVRDVGLKAADDRVVWDYAKTHDLILVSKDSDMHQRSFVFGAHLKLSGSDWGTAPPPTWPICLGDTSGYSKYSKRTTLPHF